MTKDAVYEVLQNRIFHGELAWGSRISELGLAKELGVSRTPVREAFHRLVHEGLAEYVPNAGVYLKEPNRQDIWELYDLRAALETHAVSAAVKNLTPDIFTILEKACRAMRDILYSIRLARREGAEASPDQFWRKTIMEAELPFHLTLVKASRNKRLCRLVSNSQMLIRIYGLLHTPDLSRQLDCRSYWEHYRILYWLKRGDADKASAMMHRHLIEGRDRTLEYYDLTQSKTSQSFGSEWQWTGQIRNGIDANLLESEEEEEKPSSGHPVSRIIRKHY